MKLLIFSDTHLTHKFDYDKFRYLLRIIADADRVIINGDFWDQFFTTFDKFVNSEWQRLFPVLKQKQAVYIYGNHDPHTASDERVNLFSVKQAYHYDIDADGLSLHVEHGQEMVPEMGLLSLIPAWLGVHIEHFVRLMLGRYTDVLLKHLNVKMKLWAEQNLPPNQVLVCGHTHVQENAQLQKFINSGFNTHGYGQYLLVDKGKIQLHTLKYNQPLLNVKVAQV